MNVIPLIIMVLLLIAALERNHRREPPTTPGLHGSYDHDDRDWARIKLDLLALGDPAEPSPAKPRALKHSGRTPASGSQRTPKPTQPQSNTNHREGPRAA
jgi:hypothetical protein